MKTLLKMCYSIIRKNVGFTIGLFLMSFLSVAIAFLGANFGISTQDTLMNFVDECGAPSALYSTQITFGDDLKTQIESMDGVENVSSRLMADINMETSQGDKYSVKFFTCDTSSPFTNIIHKQADVSGDKPKIMVSYKFAEYVNIDVGDCMTLCTPFGDYDVVVQSIIANIDTLQCVKDDMSAYENLQFGYVYMTDEEFLSAVEVDGISNQFLVYFNENVSVEEQKELMKDIDDVVGDNLISSVYVTESSIFLDIFDVIDTINVLCTFIPGIIWAMSLGFSFIFIKIIVENQRKTIGLLRALGYSVGKVVSIFVVYVVIINLCAVLIGMPAGYLLLNICVGIMGATYGIINIICTISYLATLAMILVSFVIGITASLMSAKAISKIDPSQAYGGVEVDDFEPPKFIANIKTDAFFKISLVSLIRNYKRQIIGAMCIAACVIAMCVGFAGVYSLGHPIDAVYGGRYRYDLMVRDIDENDCTAITENVDGIALAEPVSMFTASLCNKKVRICTVDENTQLIVLNNAQGERIYPQDGIIIEEMFAEAHGIEVGDVVQVDGYNLTVTDIAREIVYTVMYVSTQTAENLWQAGNNCVMLTLDNTKTMTEVENDITEICENPYFTVLALQKENVIGRFMSMRIVMFIFAVIAFFVGSLLIINMTIIDFNEKKTRYATLRALGTPIQRLGVISFVENLARVFVGIIVGCPFAYLCSIIMIGLLSNESQQYVLVNFDLCLSVSCIIPLLYVFIGMAICLYRIRKMNFIDSLNEVE